MKRLTLALGTMLLILSAVLARRADPVPVPPPLAVTHAAPQYQRGNLHTHSLWSDGDDFPDMIADWYKRNGYQFLALTEHNVIAEGEKWVEATTNANRRRAVEKYEARFGPAWLERREEKGKPQVRLKPLREVRSLLEEPGRFLMIPAEEITHRYAKYPIHMNAIHLRDAIKPVDAPSSVETIRVNLKLAEEQSRKTGWPNITFLNHPNFQWGVKVEEMIGAEELRYFEVFNGHPGVKNYGDATHPSCERMWDILLATRLAKRGLPVVWAVATDDSHAYHEIGPTKTNPGRGWVMVRTSVLTAESIVRAMKTGDFYCSSGVTLDEIRHEKETFSLAIRAEAGVQYTTEFIATLKGTPLEGEPQLDEKGQPLDVSRRYHAAIGKVMATSQDLKPTYTCTGQELYVRAKVTSSKLHPNPYAAGDTQVAWTQPMVPTK